jgi:hypothetical protein
VASNSNDKAKAMNRVEQLVTKRQAAAERRHAFAIEHGFAYKRPQDFRNCIVIRWKFCDKKYQVNYDKLAEYSEVYRLLGETYGLFEADDPFLDSEYVVLKAGVFSCEHYCRVWAIPNQFKSTQEFVLARIPKWAKVSYK